MKCPKCGGTGYVPTNVFGVNGAIKCDFCDGTGVFITNAVEPKTNEEWFCELSTEEKAKFMCNIYEMGKNGKEYFMRLDKCVEWLKQPHTKE